MTNLNLERLSFQEELSYENIIFIRENLIKFVLYMNSFPLGGVIKEKHSEKLTHLINEITLFDKFLGNKTDSYQENFFHLRHIYENTPVLEFYDAFKSIVLKANVLKANVLKNNNGYGKNKSFLKVV